MSGAAMLQESEEAASILPCSVTNTTCPNMHCGKEVSVIIAGPCMHITIVIHV